MVDELIRTDVAVVGAGVIGLAVAAELSRRTGSVVVLERHQTFGMEASSRNSEVIHAGIYHEPGSLKARLCVEGSRLLYEFCERHEIPCRRIGKLIVGSAEEEIAGVHHLLDQGRASGAAGLRILTRRETAEMEPELRCRVALLSPQTGILDSHRYMATLLRHATERGAVFGFGTTVRSVSPEGGRWRLHAVEADGRSVTVLASLVINAAGLDADRLAETAGIDLDGVGYRQLPCKGEYFRVSERHRGRARHLIYPPVTGRLKGQPADGVHLVIGLDGSMKIGPNRMFGVADGYTIDAAHGRHFAEEMGRYLPFLEEADLSPDTAGIRAMRIGEDSGFRDFVIREESGRGLPGLVNLVGMESPGLTSSLAIARQVGRLSGAA